MKCLVLFGGLPRKMKTAGTRQKLLIGNRRLWKIQDIILEKASLEPVFCTNEHTKFGPKNTFPADRTIAQSIYNFSLIERKFCVVRGDMLLHPSLYKNDNTFVTEEQTKKLGCYFENDKLVSIEYNKGNYWCSKWIYCDNVKCIGADWQLVNKIVQQRTMVCEVVNNNDFIEIDCFDDVEKAEKLLMEWNI